MLLQICSPFPQSLQINASKCPPITLLTTYSADKRQAPAPLHILKNYNLALSASKQPPEIPQTLLDTFAVRESVFVNEQGVVPLKHHVDYVDSISWHWVLYSPPSTSDPEEKSKPIASLRLVPPPHPPHPEPGASFEAPASDVLVGTAEERFAAPEKAAKANWKTRIDRKTTFHDGQEPYLQLGRLCVLPELRGKGCADFLLNEVVTC